MRELNLLSPFIPILLTGVAESVASHVCEDPWTALPIGGNRTSINAVAAGFVTSIDAMGLAQVACELGAGRVVTTDLVDHGVGLQITAQIGDAVSLGGELVKVFHTKPISAAQADILLRAFTIGDAQPEHKSRVIEVIRP